jgi:hypothetical protein
VERAVNLIKLLASETETCRCNWVEKLEDEVVYLGRGRCDEERSFVLRVFDGGVARKNRFCLS